MVGTESEILTNVKLARRLFSNMMQKRAPQSSMASPLLTHKTGNNELVIIMRERTILLQPARETGR